MTAYSDENWRAAESSVRDVAEVPGQMRSPSSVSRWGLLRVCALREARRLSYFLSIYFCLVEVCG